MAAGDAEAWDPLTVWQATVVDLETLRWSLSEVPDPDWIAAFRTAPTNKSGSSGYESSGSEPTISGQDIEWKVAREAAIAEAQRRLDEANGIET